METPTHSMNNLFAQLGLASDQASVEHFIETHPLAASISLCEAAFWTTSQASFLCEEMLNDADWAEVIDELNAALHESHQP